MVYLSGLFFIPLVVGMSLIANRPSLKKRLNAFINALLLLISFTYIAIALITNIKPYNFKYTHIRPGEYIAYSVVVFATSPFLWFVLYHFCRRLFKNVRVHKNAKIKKNKDFQYWRDDLDKISPNILMFTSNMDIDARKSLTATILKLKLSGYINEIDDNFVYSGKDETQLLFSEKLVTQLIRTGAIDLKLYLQLIEQETIRLKYVKKNTGGILYKILKILVTISVSALVFFSCIKFEDYVFKVHEVRIIDDIKYVKINNHDTVEKMMNSEKTNPEDYYHSYSDSFNQYFYNYTWIRADRFQYGVVWFVTALQFASAIYFVIGIISVPAALFFVIEQIRYINKSYRRTFQGNKLLNEAYALKNFLKEYSIIRERTLEEVIIYEYYLIYAVIFDMNVKVENEVIDKYIKVS